MDELPPLSAGLRSALRGLVGLRLLHVHRVLGDLLLEGIDLVVDVLQTFRSREELIPWLETSEAPAGRIPDMVRFGYVSILENRQSQSRVGHSRGSPICRSDAPFGGIGKGLGDEGGGRSRLVFDARLELFEGCAIFANDRLSILGCPMPITLDSVFV